LDTPFGLKNKKDEQMKRFCDIIFSLLVLILLLPIFCIIALIITIESGNGFIYTQKRVGKGNKDFNLYKFRTMKADSDKNGLLTVGMRDPRITRSGYFLRKYKLDEFPQLINIIKGDMSIVGPRPEVRKYVDLYNEIQLGVLSIRPGLTDYASLEYIHENELLAHAEDPEKIYMEEIMPHKIALNLAYIEKQSLKEDFKLILNTFKKLLSK
jgi:lipopolysaccharide/colanic/teichoic acid biosynthesis glycosyltransferase